jgi:hypothetical protein
VLDFDWNDAKAQANLDKHGIAFSYAIRIFSGAVVEWDSPRDGEDRNVALGRADGQVLAVVYACRNGTRWIISARPAKRRERGIYEQRS